MSTTHNAGEKLFIDTQIENSHIIDKETCEIRAVEVFAATRSASQYTYLEISLLLQILDFISRV